MGTEEVTRSPRWMVVLLVAATLALIAGGAWFYVSQRAEVHTAVERDLTAIARLKVGQISAWRKD